MASSSRRSNQILEGETTAEALEEEGFRACV
jgi:hypothetical protein